MTDSRWPDTPGLDAVTNGMCRSLEAQEKRMGDAAQARRVDDLLGSGNRLLDRARRAEWTSRFQTIFARMATQLPRLFQHNKRGSLYAIVAEAELQTTAPVPEGARLIVYVGLDGRIWARPAEEFHDGRYASIQSPS
ncbi:MAG TPA: hypothetical protein P5256_12065 [Beijerinckiaceae bacterium]|nr:hypothetical protein [Rhodoblastus sp.]HRY03859.1 hypothetical protein [Beijerinckiaceae bacterium]